MTLTERERMAVERGNARGCIMVPLSNGGFALVDACDERIVRGYAWHATRRLRCAYAATGLTNEYMHRMILGAKRGQAVDHINGDGLDNRRCNLRICTQTQNLQNRRVVPHSSRFKGVCRSGRGGKPWAAYIKTPSEHIALGRFEREEDAARAYDEAALKHFGQFARTNFP